jgi:hypothetical protein
MFNREYCTAYDEGMERQIFLTLPRRQARVWLVVSPPGNSAPRSEIRGADIQLASAFWLQPGLWCVHRAYGAALWRQAGAVTFATTNAGRRLTATSRTRALWITAPLRINDASPVYLPASGVTSTKCRPKPVFCGSQTSDAPGRGASGQRAGSLQSQGRRLQRRTAAIALARYTG